jgi:hypothetical protein
MVTALIAGFLNSVMDTVDHHFPISVFDWIKEPKWRIWFNENKGWLNKFNNRDQNQGLRKIKILGFSFTRPIQISDSWHHFKMWMIVFCALSSLEYYVMSKIVDVALLPLYAFVLFGLCWILGFNLGYDKLLLKKTWRKNENG